MFPWLLIRLNLAYSLGPLDSGVPLPSSSLCFRLISALSLACLLCLPPVAAQTLDIHDATHSDGFLHNTTVTLRGQAELRLTGTGDPMVGSVIHLDSPDAWLLMTRVSPSQAASSFLGRVRVNGAPALLDSNVRVVQYGEGAVVIPHGPDFAPLEVFSGRYFTGSSKRLQSYVEYDDDHLGSLASAIRSFRLKRGYMATLAENENGTGFSQCYVAQDGDLEVARLPVAREDGFRYARIFPWRWVTKKGVAGNIESGLNVQWLYNWNLDRNSPLNWEYVPIRQTRWWPSLDQDWRARGATHLLGYNEPDRPDQANMNVGDAIWSWPDLLSTGLRVGAPAVSDGGLGWLYDFMQQADTAGLRVDFVPVHYYRCYGNPGDPNGAANQFYNFLRGIHDVVQRPLWVTEWNNGANWTSCADPTFAQQRDTVAAIIDMLDDTPFVERYSIYNWVEDERRVKWDDGSLTDAGTVYRDQSSPLAYRQEIPPSGAGSTAAYPFDGNAHDASGLGQHAMKIGAPRFVPGRHGQAVQLDGNTDYLQVSPDLADNRDWTFAGWIYWNGGDDWQRIFDFGEDTSRYFFLTPKSSDDTLRFAIRDGGEEQRLDAAELPAGVWTHVAVTIGGDTGKLFVNGQLTDTNPQMTLDPADVGARFNYLGKSQWPADPHFGGSFDDFRFLNLALTDAQIASVASVTPPRFVAVALSKPDAAILEPYSGSLAGDVLGGGLRLFGKVGGPAWLNVNSNGSLSGTPTPADGGLNRFLVRVRSANDAYHTATLHINVPGLTMAVDAANDDAEQAANGDVNLTSSDLELVRDDDGGTGNQIIGLRFDGLAIPPGAIITNATLQFTADESQNEFTSLSIGLETADHAAAFTSTANNLGARPRSNLTVPWEPCAWTAGQRDSPQVTPNLAGLVQEVVSRPGWARGNAIAFLISGTGHRTAETFDKPGGSPAQLRVGYTLPAPLLEMTATVLGSENDAEESTSGATDLASTDLELVRDDADGTGNQTVGLRFENVTLPPDAILAVAHIQFTADEAQSESTSLSISAEAAGHAAVFSARANDLTSRPVTSASVSWTPDAWNAAGERGPLQRTPDLTALVREIITRPDWTNGNAMAFLLSGTGHRTADSADKVGGSPAMLKVEYWTELPLGTFAHWASQQTSGVSLTGDFDGDGYGDLTEYGLVLDPAVPDHGAIDLSIEGPFLHVTYTRPVAATELDYEIAWTDSLGSPWRTTGVTQEIVADDGWRRTIRAVSFRGALGQRFVRLRIVK